MLPNQRDIEIYLLSDVCVGLSNLRMYLQWSERAHQGEIVISKDNATTIVSTLLRLEEKARNLAADMIQENGNPVGVTETLRRLALNSAA